MFALNVFFICALAVLVWTAHELCLLPVARRERALRRLSALLLGVNILKYALPPLFGGKLVLPVEFSAAAYFTTPGIILMTRGKLRCWALLEWLRVRRCSGHGPGAAPCSSTGCWTRALYARPGLQRRCPSTTPPWPPLC